MTEHDDGLSQEFRLLVREYTETVFQIVCRYTNTRTEARDLVQEVWYQALRTIRTRRQEVPVRRWLVGVTINVAKQWCRSRARRRKLLERARRWLPIEAEQPAGAPTDPCISGRLWQEVERLPPLQREIAVLRWSAGLSTKETAEALGCTVGTVKSSFHEAKRTLRDRLADLEPLWASGDL